MTSPAPQTPLVFVTGGVVSSLGKGIAAASLAAILEARGLKVTMMKLDPYLNVDPGTMSPFQHGEVYVTDDGAETDLDIGHYERFLEKDLDAAANVTTGQVYSTVIAKERRGEYLGDTVESLVIAARAKLVIRQVAVSMRERAGGTPSHSPIKAAVFLARVGIAMFFAYIRPKVRIRDGGEAS